MPAVEMERERANFLQYAFGEFVLHLQEASLTRRGEPVPLAPKEFDLLRLLATHAGHLVQKEMLVKTLWPDTFVSDSSLFRNISVLRKYLGEDAIRTVPKRGYVFTLPVTRLENSETSTEMNPTGGAEANATQYDDDPPVSGRLDTVEPAARYGLRLSWPALLVAISAAVLVAVLGFKEAIARTPHAIGRFSARSGATREVAAGAARLFILNEHGRTVSVRSTLRSTVESTVMMNADPRGAAILPDGSTIYVSLYRAGRVVAFDTKNSRTMASIPVGNSPVGVAANPRPPYVYVANNYSNSVSVIDSRTNTVVRELPVGSVPTEIGISADGTRGIVTNQSGESITLIDTVENKVLSTIPVGSTPVGIVFAPDSRLAWVTLAGEDSVAVIDVIAGQIVHRIGVGSGPVRIAMTRDGHFALVSNFFSDNLSIVDTTTFQLAGQIPVGSNPVGIVLNPTGALAYVANYGSNTVSVVDIRTRSVVETLTAGSNPVELAVLPCYAVACEP